MTASFGTLLLLAGSKGRRYARCPTLPFTCTSRWAGRKARPLILKLGRAKFCASVKALLNGVIEKHTKMTPVDIEKYTDRDSYMTAEQAVQLGVVDEIAPMDAEKLQDICKEINELLNSEF